MIYPSIDKILDKVGSKYLLVNIVAKRSREINSGSKPLQLPEKEYVSKKSIGKALEEVYKDLVYIEKS